MSLLAGSGLNPVTTEGGGSTIVIPDPVWTLISTIEADTSASIEFTNSITTDYSMYMVLIDSARTSQESFLRFRIFDSAEVDSGYGYIGWTATGSSISNMNATNDSQWYMGQYSFEHAVTGEFVISGTAAGQKATARWQMGTGASTSDAGFAFFGGVVNNTNQVTGIKIFAETGNIASGTFKLYGLN
jgi:hypothetical protein